MLCCGQDSRSGTSFGGGLSGRDAGGAVTQLLRGPDEREYELRLSTSRAEGARVFVRFSLTNAVSTNAELDAEASSGEGGRDHDRALLLTRRMTIDRQLVAKRDAGQTKTAEYAQLQKELESVNKRIADLSVRSTRAQSIRSTNQSPAARAVMDTSFTMDVGETVVVGTSRLRGGSKALIALLTAVPPRSGRRE